MKRTVKKQFWFSKVEAQDLKKKAKKACLTEAALIRLLIRGRIVQYLTEPDAYLPKLCYCHFNPLFSGRRNSRSIAA